MICNILVQAKGNYLTCSRSLIQCIFSKVKFLIWHKKEKKISFDIWNGLPAQKVNGKRDHDQPLKILWCLN